MSWLVTVVQHTRTQSARPNPSSPRWMRRSAVALGLALLTVVGAWPAQAPDDAPPPPPGPPALGYQVRLIINWERNLF